MDFRASNAEVLKNSVSQIVRSVLRLKGMCICSASLCPSAKLIFSLLFAFLLVAKLYCVSLRYYSSYRVSAPMLIIKIENKIA